MGKLPGSSPENLRFSSNKLKLRHSASWEVGSLDKTPRSWYDSLTVLPGPHANRQGPTLYPVHTRDSQAR